MGRFDRLLDTIPGLGLVIMVAIIAGVAVIAGVFYLVSVQPFLVGIPLLVLACYGVCCLLAGIARD